MVVKEVYSKSILSVSKIYKYVVNPFIGCQFGCSYCYARYMKKFTGHNEQWGKFVDIKVNAAELLVKQITKKKPDEVWISGVCDPYQPLERKYELTRKCIEILVNNNWPIRIQTRSDLVLRDIDLFKKGRDCDVGLSITTADDHVRSIFEPNAPAIINRINALKKLHSAGIRTYAMIAPILPGVESLVPLLNDAVDYIYVDRMNYSHAKNVYRANNMEQYMYDKYFYEIKHLIKEQAKEMRIACSVFY